MSSVKYRENQEGEVITGKRGNREGEDITGRRENQEGEVITGKRGNREGEDIIGRRENQEGEDITRNDYLGRILEYQMPLGGARNLSFSRVVSDCLHHVLSVRYGIVTSVICPDLRLLKMPDRDYRQPCTASRAECSATTKTIWERLIRFSSEMVKIGDLTTSNGLRSAGKGGGVFQSPKACGMH